VISNIRHHVDQLFDPAVLSFLHRSCKQVSEQATGNVFQRKRINFAVYATYSTIADSNYFHSFFERSISHLLLSTNTSFF
jgi:hypothetical protein